MNGVVIEQKTTHGFYSKVKNSTRAVNGLDYFREIVANDTSWEQI